MSELEDYKLTLMNISRIITNLNYECEARIYSLNDDEMGNIFYCRDIADHYLRKYKENMEENETR